MSSVLPVRLADATAVVGYDAVDPLHQWFLGGSTAPPALATGIDHDTQYGLDLQNVGTGGLSLRATSGDGTKSLKVDNTGVAISGLSIAGSVTFTNVVITGTLGVTGATTLRSTLVVTGASTFGTGVTVGGALAVTGAAAVGGALTVTGVADFRTNVTIQQGLTVSQSATIVGNLAVNGSLTVTQTATFVTNVTMNQGLTVSQSGSIGGNWAVGGNLTVTGTATFVTNVTMNQGLAISQSGSVGGNWTITGNLDHDGSNIGFFGSAPSGKETITGVRTGTLAQLQTVVGNILSAFGNYGMLTNSTT